MNVDTQIQDLLSPTDTFVRRHVGPTEAEVATMLKTLGYANLDALVDAVIPPDIRMDGELSITNGRGEQEFLDELKEIAGQNRVLRSFIGMGYHGCVVPPVIQRNILENPGWYTQYTPYQAEISQGRLEALLNFQTMVADLTGLELANASLLDEATAAAEAMSVCYDVAKGKKNGFFVSEHCHPQTLAVVKTRAEVVGIEVHVGEPEGFDFAGNDIFGVLLQYPDTRGRVRDLEGLVGTIHDAGALAVVATDLLSLTLLRPPGDFGADVAIGSSQRFGVPMGYGGPHAAFMSTREAYKRVVPGRIIGVSRDARGKTALRMAMQTREQHIRREKATSNICTAQVLLAIMAGAYATYHGPEGLKAIATRVRSATRLLANGLRALGHDVGDDAFFDTLAVKLGHGTADAVMKDAVDRGYNLRRLDDQTVGVSLDETVQAADLEQVLGAFAGGKAAPALSTLQAGVRDDYPTPHARSSEYLTHPTFHRYHAEHEMLRYLNRLQAKDLSLTTSMIPLGSCTMKLNATSEMVPVTWPEFGGLHPYVPEDQAKGYTQMVDQLETWLANITGFAAVSFQPNAGSQGEYTGLLVIRALHRSRGDHDRNVCLIPVSAHGTNPASAVMAGMKVVTVKCDDAGNIDVADLEAKAEKHAANLAAAMITYPSTHGVFEVSIRKICDIVHKNGGKVYLDGANMNAQVGLCRPGDYGADVCHLNLHKTFCIPHGGGGPGMGPIGVTDELKPFLPGHPVSRQGGEQSIGAIAAAPWGSPSILPISHVYVGLMGAAGLKRATQVAICAANYMAKRLEKEFPILYRGNAGLVAHEFIMDLRPFKQSAKVEAEDVAKRLMDYGFHAPTMSFPVAGTLMIEPTESESLAELDRLCDALLIIREEIRAIEDGKLPADDNPLKNAPHTSEMVTGSEWAHPYPREQAAYPAAWVRDHKFWPSVARIDNAYGDRHLICSCPPLEAYEE